jgi:hypothetical protein
MSQPAPAQPNFDAAPRRLEMARAFLALCDEPQSVRVPRSLRRAVAASAAAFVLALAGPLAWASARPDPPVAAQKAEAPSPMADDEADGPGA